MSASFLAKLYYPLDIPESGSEPFTDYSRWRLRVGNVGRQTWHYLKTDEECEKWPQNYVDKYWTGQPLVSFRLHVCGSTANDLDRTFPPFQNRLHRWRLLAMVILSPSTFSQMMGTGLASMVDRCS